MPQASSKLRLQAILGVKWNFLGQLLIFLITLVGTAILSRLISPSEYGLFGMITVVTNVANMVVGLGVSMAIVQKEGLSREDTSSIFWINILVGCIMCLVFLIGAPFIARFYNQPDLVFITRVYSIGFLLHAAKSVPVGILTKESNFKHLAYSQIIANVTSFSFAIWLAFNSFGVFSLVVQVLVANALVVLLALYYAGWTPLFRLSRGSFQKIKPFIVNYLPSQLIDFLATNLDIVLIGKYFGTRTVGLYGKAIALVMIPVSLVSHVFNKSFYPIFAKVQGEPSEIRAIYLKSFHFIVALVAPIFILIAILSKESLYILFGDQWLEASTLVQVLAIYAIFFSLNSFNETFLLSQGKANWLLKINTVDKFILIILFISAIKFGVIYFAFAKLGLTILAFVIKYIIASTIHKLSFKQWFKSAYKTLIALFALIIVAMAGKMLLVDSSMIVRALAIASSSLMIFLIILYVLGDSFIGEIIRITQTYKNK